MQTVLGCNGQIGSVLVNELYDNYTQDLRLVSRHPQRVHETDELVEADLLDYEQTKHAVYGSDIVYFTVGLPMNSDLWEKEFFTIFKHVVDACQLYGVKLVFLDNTYMYDQGASIQTEDSQFVPVGVKATVRCEMTQYLLDQMNNHAIQALIGRAPEFYGPGKTQSITNSFIFDNIKNDRPAIVPLNSKVQRTLIWTPDVSKSLALLGNTERAYMQTWHLPCDGSISYSQILQKIADLLKKPIKSIIWNDEKFRSMATNNDYIKELIDLLPRYSHDLLFNSDKFKTAFPDFKVTTYDEGIRQLIL